MRHSTISISHSALHHNLSRVKTLAPHSKVLAMVKANAYGHGVKNVLPALLDADAFGVACMQEAVEVYDELNKLNLTESKPICLIEGVFSKPEWIQAQEINAMCVIHCQQQLDWALSERFTKLPVWLKVNTGMNRIGFSPSDALVAYQNLTDAGYDIIFTMHYANADQKDHPLNALQTNTFHKLVSNIKKAYNHTPTLSMCNSAGIVNFPEHHHHWIRPGIMLYGCSPVEDRNHQQLNIKPVMKFEAEIFQSYQLNQGDFVGYGSTWQAEKSMQIGIVSVGYGDGYPRKVKHAQVYCKNNHLPIIGRVSMDMLVVDLSDSNCDIGDTVELWGRHIHIDNIAEDVNTISYELLCKVTNRPNVIISA